MSKENVKAATPVIMALALVDIIQRPITKKAEKVLGIKYPHQKIENLMKAFLMTNPEFGIISEYKRGV